MCTMLKPRCRHLQLTEPFVINVIGLLLSVGTFVPICLNLLQYIFPPYIYF